MNPKLKKILRDVTLGALVGVLPNAKTDAATIGSLIDGRLNLADDNHDIVVNKAYPALKYVYNFATEDGMFHRSHRSHSSHSSHRSHYSSTSGGSSGSSSNNNISTTRTTPSTNVNTNQNLNQTPNRVVSSPQPNNVSLSLGSRLLQKGMQGNDVLELKKALVKAKVYKMGEYEIFDDMFDQKTADAVIQFKKSKQLSADDKVDAVVVYHLKNVE